MPKACSRRMLRNRFRFQIFNWYIPRGTIARINLRQTITNYIHIRKQVICFITFICLGYSSLFIDSLCNCLYRIYSCHTAASHGLWQHPIVPVSTLKSGGFLCSTNKHRIPLTLFPWPTGELWRDELTPWPTCPPLFPPFFFERIAVAPCRFSGLKMSFWTGHFKSWPADSHIKWSTDFEREEFSVHSEKMWKGPKVKSSYCLMIYKRTALATYKSLIQLTSIEHTTQYQKHYTSLLYQTS